jgi:hypothetical protein
MLLFTFTGLIILEAFYGHFKPLNQVWARLKDGQNSDELLERIRQMNNILNVTVAIQALVVESRLILAGGYSKVMSPFILYEY